jgi:hypothetical protein
LAGDARADKPAARIVVAMKYEVFMGHPLKYEKGKNISKTH